MDMPTRKIPAPPCPPRAWVATLAVLAAGLAAVPDAGYAQSTQLPGLVVTVPTAPQQQPTPPAEPPAAAPPKKAPPPKAPPKAEAKPAPRSTASNADGRPIPSGQAIVVIVNDEPITGFEVDQRARLMSLQSDVSARAQENMKRIVASDDTNQRWRQIVEQTVRENQGKSREQIMAILEQKRAAFGESLRNQAIENAKASVLPGLRKAALEELIDERLKVQEAKRLQILVEDTDVENAIGSIAKRNNMNNAQFAEHMKKLGVDVMTMKGRFKAMLSWNEVVRRRFGRDVVINQLEIDRFVSQGAKGEDDVELEVQRVVLPVQGKLEQKDFAQRIAEAEKLRGNFKGCKSIASLVGSTDAKVENLGTRKASGFNEPARTMLLNAKEGEMLPPSAGAGVVELYALCSRKVVKANDKARDEAAAELRQKEFELLARRHLRDLRQDAHIEYR
jgi:peptidyl-prolyl cis-trans isomerase SurA